MIGTLIGNDRGSIWQRPGTQGGSRTRDDSMPEMTHRRAMGWCIRGYQPNQAGPRETVGNRYR